MRLARLVTSGVDRMEDRTYDFSGPAGVPSDLVVVTGGPGSGKTSLIELIAAVKEDAGAYGNAPYLPDWRDPTQEAAKIVATWWLDEREVAEVGGTAHRVHETIIDPSAAPEVDIDLDDGLQRVLARLEADAPKVELFHAARRLPLPMAIVGTGPLASERHHRLQSADEKYGMLHAWLVELALGLHEANGLPNVAGSLAIRFDDLIRELTGTIVFAGVTRGTSPTPMFRRNDGRPRTLYELSHAEQQSVIYAVTCLRSRLERSVVLLDGPELLTTTARAAEIVAILRKQTPEAQWIVATTTDVANKLGASRVIEMRG